MSVEITATSTFISLRLFCACASSRISEEQTGVKSLGWAKRTFQLLPKSCGNLIFPLVDIAVNEGAFAPICTTADFWDQTWVIVNIPSTNTTSTFFIAKRFNL